MAEASLDEANQALCDAISTALAAHNRDPGVLTDVLVICAVSTLDDDGRSCSGVMTLLPNELPYYRILGLLDYARLRYRSEVVRAEEDDEC